MHRVCIREKRIRYTPYNSRIFPAISRIRKNPILSQLINRRNIRKTAQAPKTSLQLIKDSKKSFLYGDWLQALEQAELALKNARGNKMHQALSLNQIAYVALNLCQRDRSEETVLEALKILGNFQGDTNGFPGFILANCTLIRIYQETRRPDIALNLMNKLAGTINANQSRLFTNPNPEHNVVGLEFQMVHIHQMEHILSINRALQPQSFGDNQGVKEIINKIISSCSLKKKYFKLLRNYHPFLLLEYLFAMASATDLRAIELEEDFQENTLELYRKIVSFLEKMRAPNHPLLGIYLTCLSNAHLIRNDFSSAKRETTRALQILEGGPLVTSAFIGAALLNLIGLAVETGDLSQAIFNLRRHLSYTLNSPEAGILTRMTGVNLSFELNECFIEASAHEERVETLEVALDYAEDLPEKEKNTAMGKIHHLLAKTYQDLGNDSLAEVHKKKSQEYRQK